MKMKAPFLLPSNISPLLIVASLALIFILTPSLQHAMGLLKASNDSSYKVGYSAALNNLTGMITVPPSWHDSNLIPDMCDTGDECPPAGADQNYCMTGQGTPVINSTACIDGFVHAWKNWCTEKDYANAKYCVALFFFKDYPGTITDDSENKTLLSIMPLRSMLTSSTWNYVNESNGKGMDAQRPYINPSYNEIMKVAQKTWAIAGGVSPGQPIEFMSNMTHFKGNITFYWDQVRIKDTHGLDPTYTSNPGWDIGDGGKTIVLDGITPTIPLDGNRFFPPTTLTIDRLSSHFIELTDPHGDIIKLTR
jgi:hypothetical protein